MKRILIALVLTLILAGSASATAYYLRPGGNDLATGLDSLDAWATLAKASSFGLTAGDTLFIFGGTYSHMTYADVHPGYGGTAASPIVFKAWGDSAALFKGTATLGGSIFNLTNGSYIVVDGRSYCTPADSLYIHLEADSAQHTRAGELIKIAGTSSYYRTHNVSVYGVECDGYYGTSKVGMTTDGILIYLADSVLVDGCYVHGCKDNGVHVESSNWVKIESSTIARCAGSAIEVAPVYLGIPPRGVTVYANKINNILGSGVRLTGNPIWSLIDGNEFWHNGDSCSTDESALSLSGSRNVIRCNRVYSPRNLSIVALAQETYPAYWCDRADSNLVYNNTIFGTATRAEYSLLVSVNNHHTGDTLACSDASFTGNQFYNNLLYKSSGAYQTSYYPEIVFDLGYANRQHNWFVTCNNSSRPSETYWGGNTFQSNLIRRGSDGAADADLILFSPDASCATTAWLDYSLISANLSAPFAWAGNLGSNPLLTSESPDSYESTWYVLKWDSPCIDKGLIVVDAIGAAAEARAPGWGWGDLSYTGTRPEIGCYERTRKAANLINQPGYSFQFRSTAQADSSKDTTWVKNDCHAPCDSAVIGPILVGTNSNRFTIMTPSGYHTLYHGDSLAVIVRFKPSTALGELTAGLLMYSGALDTIPIEGKGTTDSTCTSLSKTALAFGGGAYVGQIAYDTLTIWNCGSKTLSLNTSVKVGDVFNITSGSGVSSVTKGNSKTIIVKFTPYAYRTYADSLYTGSSLAGRLGLSATGIQPGKTKETVIIREE